jgi:hypothetical protein
MQDEQTRRLQNADLMSLRRAMIAVSSSPSLDLQIAATQPQAQSNVIVSKSS